VDVGDMLLAFSGFWGLFGFHSKFMNPYTIPIVLNAFQKKK
jgi:hypothetical protein